jgi:hypothetical protein
MSASPVGPERETYMAAENRGAKVAVTIAAEVKKRSSGGIVNEALFRTHLASEDLDWLPRRFAAIRWTVTGGVWTGVAAVVAAIVWGPYNPLALKIVPFNGRGRLSHRRLAGAVGSSLAPPQARARRPGSHAAPLRRCAVEVSRAVAAPCPIPEARTRASATIHGSNPDGKVTAVSIGRRASSR